MRELLTQVKTRAATAYKNMNICLSHLASSKGNKFVFIGSPFLVEYSHPYGGNIQPKISSYIFLIDWMCNVLRYQYIILLVLGPWLPVAISDHCTENNQWITRQFDGLFKWKAFSHLFESHLRATMIPMQSLLGIPSSSSIVGLFILSNFNLLGKLCKYFIQNISVMPVWISTVFLILSSQTLN